VKSKKTSNHELLELHELDSNSATEVHRKAQNRIHSKTQEQTDHTCLPAGREERRGKTQKHNIIAKCTIGNEHLSIQDQEQKYLSFNRELKRTQENENA
jgi:hypothetical protein